MRVWHFAHSSPFVRHTQCNIMEESSLSLHLDEMSFFDMRNGAHASHVWHRRGRCVHVAPV